MNLLLITVILLALTSLGTSRVTTCVRLVAAQGMLLGVLSIVARLDHLTPHVLLLAVLTIAIKGLLIPWLLLRSMRLVGVQRKVEPDLGYAHSIVLGAIGVAVAFIIADALPIPRPNSGLIVPASLACLFSGLLLLVTRRKAVTQVIGYLVMENGIFVFGLALGAELPWLVEMGVLLDVFVGVFVMGITIYQVSREFDHIDASRLQELNDLAGGRGLVVLKNGHARQQNGYHQEKP